MDPVLVTIGGFEIRWYSVLIIIAVFIGYLLATKEARRFNISKDFMFNCVFWTVFFALVGARLYYVIFNWSYYSSNLGEIFQIWKGGLAIHGGIIGGVITLLVYGSHYKVRTPILTDLMVVPLILGQAIGRWGNFFNGEAHGAATTLEALSKWPIPQFIVDGMYINGVYYTPTFLIESILCIVGFVILLIVRRTKHFHVGGCTSIYLMYYGIVRFFIERTRTDSLMVGGFKSAQIISIVMFVVGLIWFMILFKKPKFEDLYNETDGKEQFF